MFFTLLIITLVVAALVSFIAVRALVARLPVFFIGLLTMR